MIVDHIPFQLMTKIDTPFIDSHCHLDFIYGRVKQETGEGGYLDEWKKKFHNAFPKNFKGLFSFQSIQTSIQAVFPISSSRTFGLTGASNVRILTGSGGKYRYTFCMCCYSSCRVPWYLAPRTVFTRTRRTCTVHTWKNISGKC